MVYNCEREFESEYYVQKFGCNGRHMGDIVLRMSITEIGKSLVMSNQLHERFA